MRKPAGARGALALACAALLSGALPASPASSQAVWTGSMHLTVVGHGELSARVSGSYDLPLFGNMGAGPRVGDWNLYYEGPGEISERTAVLLKRDPGWKAQLSAAPGWWEGPCEVSTTREDPLGIEGTLSCTGLPFFQSGLGETVDITGTFSAVSPAVGTPSGGCLVEGKVTDRAGKAVEGAHVQLHFGTNVLDTATRPDGTYVFTDIGPQEGFAATDPVHVRVLAEEYAHQPSRFQVLVGDQVAGVKSDEFSSQPGVDCRRDFPVAALPEGYEPIGTPSIAAPALFQIYQDLQTAWALADTLGVTMDDQLPLRVFALCEQAATLPSLTCPEANSAFFTRPPVGGGPYIALSTGRSGIGATQTFSRLHEFGHAFMSDAFGGIPLELTATSHGGYYRNATSNDSWDEGFATFYAVMVAKHVAGASQPTVTPWADLEIDRKAWEDAGRIEEIALAGVLLDLEDGPADYGGGDKPDIFIPADQVRLDRTNGVFSGPAGTAALGDPWTAELLAADGREVAVRGGAVAVVDGRRVVMGTLPADVATVRVTVRPGRAGDDDPIDGDVKDLWDIIAAAKSGSSHIKSAYELYRVMRAAFGGDRDADGIDDVDEIFIAHGFFADIAGGVSNRTFDQGETPGQTSHHAWVATDGTSYPEIIPRREPPPIPPLEATIDTGGVEATALVQVSLPSPNEGRNRSILIEPQAGVVMVPVPPPGYGGSVSVIMLADGYAPVAALDVEADAFWEEAERRPDESFLAASVTMEARETEAAAAEPGPGGIPRELGLVLLLVAFALGGLSFWTYRKRQPAPARAPGQGWWPTHVVPPGGVPFWTGPDPAVPPAGVLPEGTALVVVEARGAWAVVRAANGWTGWADLRSLVPSR
ncbi:MAG: carboxypeptidase regulatory-like domain-containing protein [Actinobacteria bacterium]|nr:carboxypeptidase regulatory-like domain-containing protein [Actinomycetota bacterium]